MVEASDFVDGAAIQWGSLTTVLLGSSILAYFQGAAAVFLSLADIPIAALSFVANYLGEFLGLYYGFLPVTVQAAFAGAAQFVTSTGIFGYVLALVIVLSAFYAFREVVSRVR